MEETFTVTVKKVGNKHAIILKGNDTVEATSKLMTEDGAARLFLFMKKKIAKTLEIE